MATCTPIGAVAGTGTTGDEGGGGAASKLAVGLGHVHRTGFEAAGHQFQALADVVKAVEGAEEALARYSEYVVDPLRDERVGQDASPRAGRDPRLTRLCQLHPCLLRRRLHAQ